jgi:RNA polymerase sigma factor (sigma-70 family)
MARDSLPPLFDSIAEAYRRNGDRLRDMASRGGRDEAPDLVQDAVVKMLESEQRADVRDPARFLYQVTRNVLVDRFRSRARREKVMQYGLEDIDAVDPGAGPERTVIARQRLEQTMAVIDRMPPRRREAFLLCRVKDLTYAETAKKMGVSVQAVEKHMSCAMAQLLREFNAD